MEPIAVEDGVKCVSNGFVGSRARQMHKHTHTLTHNFRVYSVDGGVHVNHCRVQKTVGTFVCLALYASPHDYSYPCLPSCSFF